MNYMRKDVICAVLLTALAVVFFVQNHVLLSAHACPGAHCQTLP
jgi:hypothetical protein